jgi:hypothetical protein
MAEDSDPGNDVALLLVALPAQLIYADGEERDGRCSIYRGGKCKSGVDE